MTPLKRRPPSVGHFALVRVLRHTAKRFSEGSTKLKDYNSDDRRCLLVLIRAPIRAQFIIIAHEFQRSLNDIAIVTLAFSLSLSSLFLLLLLYIASAYTSVAICNDRRRHLHSTLHVPSVYSRKTCNPTGDQSIYIYIQIPFLPETHGTCEAERKRIAVAIDPRTSFTEKET